MDLEPILLNIPKQNQNLFWTLHVDCNLYNVVDFSRPKNVSRIPQSGSGALARYSNFKAICKGN